MKASRGARGAALPRAPCRRICFVSSRLLLSSLLLRGVLHHSSSAQTDTSSAGFGQEKGKQPNIKKTRRMSGALFQRSRRRWRARKNSCKTAEGGELQTRQTLVIVYEFHWRNSTKNTLTRKTYSRWNSNGAVLFPASGNLWKLGCCAFQRLILESEISPQTTRHQQFQMVRGRKKTFSLAVVVAPKNYTGVM